MATTTSFIQRVTLTSGPTLCAWIGPESTSTEAFLVQVLSSDVQAVVRRKLSIINVLVDANLAGREVDVQHNSDSAAVNSTSTSVCNIAETPLVLDAMEITQSIQDLAHSIPLLAGKRTVVRLYLSNYSGSSMTVRGEIAVRRSATTPATVVPSLNIVVLNPSHAGNLTAKRDDATRSLNFVLPAMHTAEGQLNIRISSIINTVSGSEVAIGCTRRPTVWFHRSPPLRVRVLGIRYSMGTPPVTHVPLNQDFALLLSWLRRAYPAGQVIGSTAIVDATATPPFGCGQVNAQIAAVRALDMSTGADARTHYYGLVADSGFWMRGCSGVPATPDPSAVGSGPTGPGTWGWDFDGSYGDWYGGHELGHSFGRRHPGFCGESESDLDNYPFANGQLANADGSFCGFDVGDPVNGLPLAALPGTQWHEIMTYCSRQWLSAYTYLGIRTRLFAEDSLGAGAGPAMRSLAAAGRPDERFPQGPRPRVEPDIGKSEPILVSVIVTVNLTRRQGKVEYVNPLERGSVKSVVEKSAVTLRAMGPSGELLQECPVEVRLNSELLPSDDQVGIVDAAIEVDPETRSIELVFGDTTADSFAVGGPEPGLQAVRLLDRERAEFGLTLAAPIASNQTYSVQVSTDGGESWETLGVGLKEPSFVLDRSQYKKGIMVQVRVLGTNGLVSSIVTSETVQL